MGALFSSCATAPVGGPTQYARERAAQLAPGASPDLGGEELKFGLLCAGKMCSEEYKVNAAGWVPILGFAALFPDKPSTVKMFSHQRKYQSLNWLADYNSPQDSDLIIKMRLANAGKAEMTEVLSAYSRKPLYRLQGGYVGSVGAAVYDAFKPGTALYRAVAADREDYFKRRDQASAGGGISKEDLEGIVKAAVSSAQAVQVPKAAAPAAEIRSDVDEPSYKAPERPDDFAVVVGVERYSDLPAALYAERDAEAVKNHLLALGFPSRNVILMLGEKASRTAIEKYLESWLPRNVKEESRVFFYFSGHGAPDVKTGEAFLVPWDGDANFLENTGYPVKRLYASLNALKAREVLVALDACFSGAGGRSVLAHGARPLVTKVETGIFPQGRMSLFAAAAENEITSTLDGQGHGIFTYYFLKGLSGQARDKDGNVTVRGLQEYLKPKVQDEARRQNREQNPVLMGEQNGDKVIFRP